MNERVAVNKRIADKLLDDGLIDETDYRRAIDYARTRGKRLEEALLELDIVAETPLLRYIATSHKTQFVSTEKLARAKLDSKALKVITKQTAKHFGVFPLLLDRKNDKLIVATADPDHPLAARELSMAANVENILFMVARPAAVVAAIARAYERDKQPFKKLMLANKNSNVDASMLLWDPYKKKGRRRKTSRGRGGGRETSRRKHPNHSDGGRPRTDSALAVDLPDNVPPIRAAEERQRTANLPPARAAAPAEEEIAPAPAPAPAAGFGGVAQPTAQLAAEGTWRPPAAPPTPAPPMTELSAGAVRLGEPHHEVGSPYPLQTAHPGSTVHPPDEPFPLQTGYPPPGAAQPPPTGLPLPSAAMSGGVQAHAAQPQALPLPGEAAYPGSADESGHHLASQYQSATPPPAAEALMPPPATVQMPPAPNAQLPPMVDEEAAEFGFDDAQFDMVFDPHGVLGDQAKAGGQSHFPSVIPESRYAPHSALGFGVLSKARAVSDPPPPAEVVVSAPYVESLRVLVGLLENDRPDLRGHSTFVARLTLGVCERVRLGKALCDSIVLASYLHDLGRMGSLHLTTLNVAQFEGHQELAVKLAAIPQQLMGSVGLPDECLAALESLYEQANGQGFPKGLSGKEIPIGARILSVADSYAELTRNPRNAYRRMLSPDDAILVLQEHSGSVFDPNIVEVFERATGGEKILTELLADRHRVLVVDPDPEETLVLQLRLLEQGFDVHVARGTLDAREALAAHAFAVVVSEIDLDEPDAGFHLRAEAAQSHPNASWVFLSSRSSRTTAQRAFDMDVDDFIAKPASAEIVVAKLIQLIDRREARVTPRGVSGSLAQMSLPDIVQILWHGRKTCALDIVSGDTSGQVHFREGRVVHATWAGQTAEAAFYQMLTIGEHGEFSVDPEFVPTQETITASPEGLLLEGMRLLDEGRL